MESAIESRLSFRIPKGFVWHETHFCIEKREAVYLHNSARVNNTFELDSTSFQCALAALGHCLTLICRIGELSQEG